MSKDSLGDITSRVSTAESKIEQNSSSITSLVSRTETVENKFGEYSTTVDMNSAISQTADSISASMEATYATKTEVSDKRRVFTNTPVPPYDIGDLWVQGSTGDIKVSMATRSSGSFRTGDWTKASKYTDDTKANAVQEELNNLSVGGRNLLRDSRLIRLLSNNSNNYPITCTETQEEDITFYRIKRTEITLNPTTLSTYNSIPVSQYAYSEMVGKQVTLSFKARASEECTCSLMSYVTSEGTITNFSKNTTSEPLPAVWKTFTQVIDEFPEIAETAQLRWCPLNVTIPSGKIDEFYIDVRDWKFELGNKATDWTPAPEDIDDDISSVAANAHANEVRLTTAESSIQQLANQISTLVTDGAGASLMTQTENGWTFSIGELLKTISDTSEEIGALNNSINSVGGNIDGLQSAIDKLGEFGSYIKIKTDGDQPCIELGGADSNFKVLITNTDIRFMEGTAVPAYINNQSLNIEKALVEDELQIGGFVWKKRTNGNVGLIWKGENE